MIEFLFWVIVIYIAYRVIGLIEDGQRYRRLYAEGRTLTQSGITELEFINKRHENDRQSNIQN